MSAPTTSVCEPWGDWADVAEVCTGTPTLTDGQKALVLSSASDIMWALSGRQFGLCAVRARPMPYCGHFYGFPTTFWGAGAWYGWNRQPSGPCSCGAYYYVHLGRAPISSVDQVIVAGVVVDPTLYRVDEWNYLVRTDGNPWPLCTDLAEPNDNSGVFEVAWHYGVDVPVVGKTAWALLACRLASDVSTDEGCAIPASASNVDSEGVTIKLDLDSVLEKGRTGIGLVDWWLQTVNPAGPSGYAEGFDAGARREVWRVGTG